MARAAAIATLGFGVSGVAHATSVFGPTGSVVDWTAPVSGEYLIRASGAAGGIGYEGVSMTAGGDGASLSGDFHFSSGDVLEIAVGERGGDASAAVEEGSGGGGGGGGDLLEPRGDAPNGLDGMPGFQGGADGVNGRGGSGGVRGSDYGGGGGAGYETRGTDGGPNQMGGLGGMTPSEGYAGGQANAVGGPGGFGGGYSGGGGAAENISGFGSPVYIGSPGGGGGSYDGGADPTFTLSYRSGVSIDLISADVVAGVPEPGAWTMMLIGAGLLGASLRRRRGLERAMGFDPRDSARDAERLGVSRFFRWAAGEK